jgi:glycine cleavage system H protein
VKDQDLLYCETHEWVHVSEEGGEKIATIGLSAFAIKQLTDLVYMELPEAGRQVTAGEEFGEVESVKAVSPIYCPVSGEVIEVNTDLPDRLDVLSEDPYESGWIARIKVSDDSALSTLMDYDTYQKQCQEEG